MSHVQASDDVGEHRLRDEPLPVRIPSGILKYPREWCLNDGLPKPTEPIPYSDINLMRLYLDVFSFTYVAQGMLVYLIWKNLFTDDTDVICDGCPIRFPDFVRSAKYGSKKDAKLQEAALGMIKQAAEEQGFTLGEIKALFYIASLSNSSHGGMKEEEYELGVVQGGRTRLKTGWLTLIPAFEWGGDLRQFQPILEKALDYYEKVVIPDWCHEI
jgi:hypothetical protein